MFSYFFFIIVDRYECSSMMLLPSGRSSSDVPSIQAAQNQLQFSILSKPGAVQTTSSRELANSAPVTAEEHNNVVGSTAAVTLSNQNKHDLSCSVFPCGNIGNWETIDRHLQAVQENLKNDWTVHMSKDGRLYYCK